MAVGQIKYCPLCGSLTEEFDIMRQSYRRCRPCEIRYSQWFDRKLDNGKTEIVMVVDDD